LNDLVSGSLTPATLGKESLCSLGRNFFNKMLILFKTKIWRMPSFDKVDHLKGENATKNERERERVGVGGRALCGGCVDV